MKKNISSRLLSMLLVFAMLFTMVMPAGAVGTHDHQESVENLSFKKVDGSSLNKDHASTDETAEKVEYALDDVVRVSIVMEKAATLSAGYSSENVAANTAAVSYRNSLKEDQKAMAAKIEKTTGEKLDVVWNLTLAANLISANIKYGQIEQIAEVEGVKEVVIENRYEPQVVEGSNDPEMISSGTMIDSYVAWESGFTGAGSKVAVIDTGIDDQHVSFDADAYNHAMGLNAEEKGMTLEEYKAYVGVLTNEFVASVAGDLNASSGNVDVSKTYVSDKIPYAYNYVDKNYNTDHMGDTQGEHGSHVEGIAAANRFVSDGEGGYSPALEAVKVQGVAPDAQIVTMKVFGAGGGAYDSDYMAAIEDAIVLRCDSANLSLGSGNPGFAFSATYQGILDSLADSSTVVAMSAGNSSSWNATPKGNMPGYLYSDDISMAMNGSPGSFTNSLGVASVDNIGKPLKFGDLDVYYSESTYSNPPIAATLPGINDFILIDNVAVDASGNNLLIPYADIIQGKVVMVYRGSSSFYQKMDAAAELGASACVVVNNQSGTINMDLSSATSAIPCVAITQLAGEKIKAAYEQVTTNGLTYWQGTFEVCTGFVKPNYFTMSSFSSWGVPGALTMKPEITAPGGNIFSVWGANKSSDSPQSAHDQYESMSGTSMASPQVAGMAAVMGEYIRANKLTEKTGLTARQLTNSLLMSTAVPMWEDYDEYGAGYYPILRQGSGLGNVGNAVQAKSYILMDADSTASYADGKVKAELGDDPTRTGEYSWGFSINNMSGDVIKYSLSTDLFTQDLVSDGTHIYMDTWTTLLDADFTYTVNGETFTPKFGVEADVNKDGETTTLDVKAILDYVTGNVTEDDIDVTVADIDGDGSITSADAHALLQHCETTFFEVPANGKADVKVTAKLTKSEKAYLDTYYNGGAYVQGYTYVNAITSGEGEVLDVEHSIPVLGVYGSWTDASMFDNTSIVDVTYGTNDKVPYTGNTATNGLYVRYGTDTNNYWYLGNPYTTEDAFPADRLAVGNEVNLYQFRYNLIRNAAALVGVITNEAGKVLHIGSITNNAMAAYYHTNQGAWMNTATATYTLNKTIASLGLKEGEKVTFGLYAIPEYYGNPTNGRLTADEVKAVVESGVLGDGASISFTAVVDNTPPVVTGITKDLLTGDLTVTAQDDNYVAAIMVANASGSKIYATSYPAQDAPNQSVTVPVDLEGQNPGSKVLVIVGDYAGNEIAYEIEYSNEPVSYVGNMYGFTYGTARGSGDRWVQIDKDILWCDSSNNYQGEGMDTVSASPIRVTAAEYVDGYVFMASAGAIYVAPQGEWDQIMKVGKTDITFYDMAYDTATQTLYGLDNANSIYTIDTTTGATELVATITVTNPRSTSASYLALLTMTIDDASNFYFSNYGNSMYVYLYKMTLDQVEDGAVTIAPVVNTNTGYMYTSGYTMYNRYPGSMAWDHDNDLLYLATAYNLTRDYDSRLYVVDTETGKASLTTNYRGGLTATSARAACLGVCVSGLYIVPTATSTEPEVPATSLELSATELTMMKGTSAKLTADVYPWNLPNKSVTWTSSDEAVAAIAEDGTVTAVGAGTATITVTTNATPNLTATCDVTVTLPPVASMTGLIYAADGSANWSDFSSDAPENAVAVAAGSSYMGGTLAGDIIYLHDGENMFAVDADGFEVTSLGGIASSWLFADAAPIPEEYQAEYGAKIVAPCMNGTYLECLDPEAGSLSYWSGIATYYADDPMALIAYVGETVYNGYDALEYYMITEGGELWSFILFNGESLYRKDLGATGLNLGNVSANSGECYGSMVYDAETEALFIASYVEGDTAQMYVLIPETLQYTLVGEFGEEIWPAVALYQYERVTELTLSVKPEKVTMYVDGTVTLETKIKPASYTGGLIFKSSNEAVATVDANGVVTGVSAGTAYINVTTIDVNEQGEHKTAIIPVTVRPLFKINGTVSAQVTTPDGAAWADIDLMTMAVTANKTGATPITGGNLSNGGIYVSDVDLNGSTLGNFYRVDPETFDETAGSGCSSSYAPLDAAIAPATTFTYTEEDGTVHTLPAFGEPMYWANLQGLYMLVDFEEGSISGWNMNTLYSDLGAIAYAGSLTVGFVKEYVYSSWNIAADDDTIVHMYLALGADGSLYNFFVAPYYNNDPDVAGYSLVRGPYGSVNKEFADFTALSMDYLEIDDENWGLLIADATDGSLYFANLAPDEAVCSKVGTVADALNLTAIYNATLAEDSNRIADKLSIPAISTERAFAQLSVPYAETAEAKFETVNAADGTAVNKVSGGTDKASATASKKNDHMTPVNGVGVNLTVDVDVTEDVDVTNGKITVSYDPAVLTLIDVDNAADFASINATEGTLVLAYANDTAIPAGDAIMKLHFAFKGAVEPTAVTVLTEERNDDVNVEDGEVTITIGDGEHTHTYKVTDKKEATCTEAGSVTYTCSCGDSYTESIPALGHDVEYVELEPTCTDAGALVGICTRCDEYFEIVDIYPATGHEYDSGVITANATCTENGVKTYTCVICGETKTESIPATGHYMGQWETTKAATCTEAGEEVLACTNPGCDYKIVRTIAATGHTLDEGTVTKEATCDEAGELTFKCTVCGETVKTVVIPTTAHTMDEGTVTKEATCDEVGELTFKCTVCGETLKTVAIPATGHTTDEGTVTKTPTCTEAGEKVYKCTVCGETLNTVAIAATGHTTDNGTVTLAPTCTAGGVKTFKCTACDVVLKVEAIAATGHSYGEWTVTKAATCTVAGVETMSCANCDAKLTRAIVPTGHTYNSGVVTKGATCTEAGVKTYTCTTCADIKTESVPATGHIMNSKWTVTKAATCTTAGEEALSCKYCDFEYTRTIAATGHSYGKWTVTKAATCTEAGEETMSCANCDAKLTRATALIAHKSDKGTVTTAATCTEAGVKTYKCTVCDEVLKVEEIAATGHKYGAWTVTTEADCQTNGVETHTCATCGETETRETGKSFEKCPSKKFTDVSTSKWYHAGVDFVIENDIMNGVSETAFEPEAVMTRAQLVAVLYRMAGEPEVTGTCQFTDVKASAYYYKAVVWAAENEIVTGTSDTTFSPKADITREQLVTILYRYAKFSGKDVTTNGDVSMFSDAGSIASYAVNAVAWATANGIIDGVDGSTVAPKSTATRAQVATIIMRYMGI